MVLIGITQGPSKWDILLATFDPKPPQMQGVRTLDFVLANDTRFYIELTGVAWDPYPSLAPIQLTGVTHGSLPRGYASDGPVLITYDPTRHKGIVSLDLVCPIDGGELVASTGLDGSITIRRCVACDKVRTRVNPLTGRDEWLDGGQNYRSTLAGPPVISADDTKPEEAFSR